MSGDRKTWQGRRAAYRIIQGDGHKTFGPYTTQAIALDIKGVLARCYPGERFKIRGDTI